MTRIKQAWLALCGKLPERVRYVDRETVIPGDPHCVTLYKVGCWPGECISYTYINDMADVRLMPSFYLTCEAAHAASDGKSVEKVRAIRIGQSYYIADHLRKIDVEPKPKRPKGKR